MIISYGQRSVEFSGSRGHPELKIRLQDLQNIISIYYDVFCDILNIEEKSCVSHITKITLSGEGGPRPDNPTQQDVEVENQEECFAPFVSSSGKKILFSGPYGRCRRPIPLNNGALRSNHLRCRTPLPPPSSLAYVAGDQRK